ncbi:MAG: DUF4278 domain-containing protein [Cyanophyceae cyanobacterium]
MQLIYRGISYQSNLTRSATDKTINGKYRGVSYQIGKTRNATLKNGFTLKYRGREYIKLLP